MGVLTEGSNCVTGVWSAATVAKSCGNCYATAALVFCRTDNMFMCLGCDTRVHENVRHERVWVCEVCEQAPAVVTCKADAAALCVTCDHDIHSANPLARRHERIPVIPFYDAVEPAVKSTAGSLLNSINSSNVTATTPSGGLLDSKMNTCIGHHEEEFIADPWISSNTVPSKLPAEIKSVDFLFSDNPNFLDFEYSVSMDTNYNSANDSIVPVQTATKPSPFTHHEKHFDIDFSKSHIKSYNSTPSLCQSVSSSSLDVGVVPEGSTISDISYNFGRSVSSSVELGNSMSGNQGEKLIGMDREARVLRYREKRKNRKFEKTIRYASRKAYAETRPRIKGRFAKKTNAGVDSDIDQIFSAVEFMVNDSPYGVVPSYF